MMLLSLSITSIRDFPLNVHHISGLFVLFLFLFAILHNPRYSPDVSSSSKPNLHGSTTFLLTELHGQSPSTAQISCLRQLYVFCLRHRLLVGKIQSTLFLRYLKQSIHDQTQKATTGSDLNNQEDDTGGMQDPSSQGSVKSAIT